MNIEDFSSKTLIVISCIIRLIPCAVAGVFAYILADSHYILNGISAVLGTALVIGSRSVFRILEAKELSNTAALALLIMLTFGFALMMWPLLIHFRS